MDNVFQKSIGFGYDKFIKLSTFSEEDFYLIAWTKISLYDFNL